MPNTKSELTEFKDPLLVTNHFTKEKRIFLRKTLGEDYSILSSSELINEIDNDPLEFLDRKGVNKYDLVIFDTGSNINEKILDTVSSKPLTLQRTTKTTPSFKLLEFHNDKFNII
ncbi:hypothetical protein Goe21_01240 [Bacillus phage vB_BsuM-Goe21]|nr:hypothetical protein Goe21_01240 [Bacillus phage vB_BsuM-Goe21]